eukprot:1125164-Ditylum_brightwellii.AAC.1
MPVLFVSGGVTEGGYRFALSQLYALVGGIRCCKDVDATADKGAGTRTGKKKKKKKMMMKSDFEDDHDLKDHDQKENDNNNNDDDDDIMQKYEWHWFKLSGGTYDEITPNASTVLEAIQSVPDAVSIHTPSNNSSSRDCAAHVSAYGGSSRACHNLWYDSRLHSVCTFGGFTDMVARKSHVQGGAFTHPSSKDNDDDDDDDDNINEYDRINAAR